LTIFLGGRHNAFADETLRQVQSLDGIWQIAEGRMDQAPAAFDHTVSVPGLVSLASPEFAPPPGPVVSSGGNHSQKDPARDAFWYRRTFRVDRRVPAVAQIKVRKAMYGNLDAIHFLRHYVLSYSDRSPFFIYLDPPYFVKGSQLYLNYYERADHALLARFLKRVDRLKWLVTYDDTKEIRSLYDWCNITPFNLRYSAHNSHQGSEIVICERDLILPADIPGRCVA